MAWRVGPARARRLFEPFDRVARGAPLNKPSMPPACRICDRWSGPLSNLIGDQGTMKFATVGSIKHFGNISILVLRFHNTSRAQLSWSV